MNWNVQFYDTFDAKFEDLPETVQDELLAHARLLEEFGPQLGRPRVDTLNVPTAEERQIVKGDK